MQRKQKMIVAVAYQFHDHELRTLIIDTEKLASEPTDDPGSYFESDVRRSLEGSRHVRHSQIPFRGDLYSDHWGQLGIEFPPCEVFPPVKIDSFVHLHVIFED